MRQIGQPRGQESQLHIITETLNELILQVGDIPKLEVLRKARHSMLIGLPIVILIIGFSISLIFSFINTKREISIPPSSLYPFYGFIFIFIAGIVLLVARGFYAPRYMEWYLDCSRQQMAKKTINLMGQTRTVLFAFNDIKALEIEEHHDPPYALIELYVMLKSNKQFTLSVSSYTTDKNQILSNLQCHQNLAKKMGDYIFSDNNPI